MDKINFLRGVPAEEALESMRPLISLGYQETLKTWGTGILQYTSPYADFNGFIPLRESLSVRYGLDAVNWSRVICTNGGMEMLSLLFKCSPAGSFIATEALTYDRVLQDAKQSGLHVFGVRHHSTGIDLADLEQTLENKHVSLFYHIPFHQNPTGITSIIENINAVAELCRQRGVLYVCDIAYDELRYDGTLNPRIDLTDPRHSKTCLVGSFTKTISPGTKCGFGIFPQHVADQMTPVIANARLNPNYPTQAMIDWLIQEGHFDTHVRELRNLYAPRLMAMVRSLQEHFPGLFLPDLCGGFFAFLPLRTIARTSDFLELTRERGVLIDIASVCTPDIEQRYRSTVIPIRLAFPALTTEQIAAGVAIIAQSYRDAC